MIEQLPQPKSLIYLNRYIKLVQYSQTQQFDGYTEKHHILPRSMFPQHTKDKNNIVIVTARIHFLLHYMLWKAYRNHKTWNAFKFMNSMSNNHKRYFNSRLYQTLRSEMKLTDEHKAKISKKLKGRVFSEETKAKMSAWQKGVPKPELVGSKRTNETKAKMSAWQKGVPKPHQTGSNNHESVSFYIGSHFFETITECCNVTGLSKHSIRNYIHRGKFPRYKQSFETLLSYVNS